MTKVQKADSVRHSFRRDDGRRWPERGLWPQRAGTLNLSIPLLEDDEHGCDDKSKAQHVIPLNRFLEIQAREHAEDNERDHFLNRLELHHVEGTAESI